MDGSVTVQHAGCYPRITVNLQCSCGRPLQTDTLWMGGTLEVTCVGCGTTHSVSKSPGRDGWSVSESP